MKRGTTGDGDYQALSKKVDIIDTCVIPDPEESQHETPGQNETFEEPKLSLENPVYTELGENRVHGRNTAEDGTYQKLVKRHSDCVIQFTREDSRTKTSKSEETYQLAMRSWI